LVTVDLLLPACDAVCDVTVVPFEGQGDAVMQGDAQEEASTLISVDLSTINVD
jgi:hypothetical protein